MKDVWCILYLIIRTRNHEERTSEPKQSTKAKKRIWARNNKKYKVESIIDSAVYNKEVKN